MTQQSEAQAAADLQKLLRNRRYRLDNLYWIRDEQGRRVKFRMWAEQERLYREMHHKNVILKARQLGFTTFIQIFMLDTCLWRPNTAAATVAHRLDDAKEIFGNKIRYAYDNLPDEIKAMVPAEEDSARKLSFGNGSSILVDTMLRGGTFQRLHVSEHGKICARFPDKARELRTGALNTLHKGSIAFIESTAEGQEGDFYDMCQRAMAMKAQGKALSELDWKFFFFPWWADPKYRLAADFPFTETQRNYFADLAGLGIVLEPEQMAWYVKTEEVQRDDMKREFPSTPEEAFAAAIEGAYYAREMAYLRKSGRIGTVDHNPAFPVNTFWDIGLDDEMVIWFHQEVKPDHHLIDYYANSGEGFRHYAEVLRDRQNERGYMYGVHYLPHDGNQRILGETVEARADTLRRLGVKPVEVVGRAKNGEALADEIQEVRNWLPMARIDETRCDEGIKRLDRYRKEWDDQRGVWKDRPRHDDASHAADSLRTGVMGYETPSPDPRNKPRDRYDESRYGRKQGTTWMSA